MSTTYPYYSNAFPDDIDNFDPFEDPDSSSLPLMNLYYSYIENNDIDGALGVLDRNPDLKPKIIDANRLNLLRDSLLSIEQYYKDNIENIDNVFIATYGNAGATGVTTSAEIEAAYQAGKACFCVYNGRCYALSSRAGEANHYFSVFYNKSRFTVHCVNDQWSTGTENFASSSDLSSGLSTKQNTLTFDASPTSNSTNPVTSGGVYTALSNKQDNLPSQTGNNGKYLTTNGSSLSWGDITNSNVYFVDYGTTDTGMIDAYNEGKLVVTNFGSSLCYLMWSNDIQYYFYSIDCDINSIYNSVFHHRFIECVAIYDSLTQTLSWESSSHPVHNTYEATYNDTTQDSFLDLDICYREKYCVYCYYNNEVYYLSGKYEDTNNISFQFVNLHNNTQYTVVCTSNKSDNTVTWSYHSSPLTVYATCSTAATTAAKVATTTNGDFVLATGAKVTVKFTYRNSASSSATLNVDNTGAKTIYRAGSSTTRYYWQAGEVLDFVYDGTYWVMEGKSTATTTDYGVTRLETSSTSTSTSTALTPASLNSFALSTVSGLPVYSSSNTYAVGDKVRYGNSMYVCNTAITSGEGWNSAHWTVLPSLLEQIENNNVFVASYNSTTSAQLEAAYQAGKFIYCIYSTRVYWMAYRYSATNHQFVSLYSNTRYSISCSNDTWSATVSSMAFAPLSSPALTGVPTAPTANLGTNTTQIATTEFVTNAIASASTTGNIFIAPWGQNGSAVKGAYDAGKTVILIYNPTGTEWSNSTIYMYLQNVTESPSSESTQYIRYYFYGVGARTTSLNVANPCRAWFGNLRYNTTSNAYSWTNPVIVSPDTFIAVYGSTTNDELVDAYNNHQNITLIYDVTSTQQHYVAPLVFANVGSTNSIWDFACIIGTSSPTRHWFRLNQTGTWSTGTNTLATT